MCGWDFKKHIWLENCFVTTFNLQTLFWIAKCSRSKGGLQGTQFRVFYLMYKVFFLALNDTSFITIDQGIHILQLKRNRKFLLFSLFFLNVCVYIYIYKSPQLPSPSFYVLYHICKDIIKRFFCDSSNHFLWHKLIVRLQTNMCTFYRVLLTIHDQY